MPSFLPTDGVIQDVTNKSPMHCCRHCGKEFKYIKRRDIHEETCLDLTKSTRNDYDDNSRSVTIHDLFSVIMELKQEVKDLREELKSKQGFMSRRPIEILEWLNNRTKPSKSFKDDLNNTLVCSNADLQTLFQRNFVEAVTEIMHKYILSQPEVTIRAFTQKDQTLYHFNGNKWDTINNEEWECIVGIIVSKFATAFSVWVDENITDLENSNQQDDWLEKTKKIHDTSPTRFSSIKKRIYNYIKQDARQCN